MIIVNATTISDAFHQILFKFLERVNGKYVNAYTTDIDSGSFGKDKFEGDSGHVQQRLQADLAVAEISFPATRPLAVTFPENIGIPPVATQDAIEDYFSQYLMNAEMTVNEEYTYGNRMLAFESVQYIGNFYMIGCPPNTKIVKFNQIDWVIKHFKDAPGNNHCCVEIAKGDDVLLKSSPCLRLISFKIVNGKLNITVFFRSWDFWSGFPINLGGLQLLNEYIASEIGIETGKMFAISDGLHIYTYNIPLALQRIGE